MEGTTEGGARKGLLPPPPPGAEEGGLRNVLRRESEAEAAEARAAYLARLTARVERRDGHTRTWCREMHAAAEATAPGVPVRACADIAAAEERVPLVSRTEDEDDGGNDEKEETRLLVSAGDEEEEEEEEMEKETETEDGCAWWSRCCGCRMQ